MDWEKYGKDDAKTKRIAVPVKLELDKLIQIFKSTYPDRKFSDAKVLGTFIEAGAKLWIAQLQQSKQSEQSDSVSS